MRKGFVGASTRLWGVGAGALATFAILAVASIVPSLSVSSLENPEWSTKTIGSTTVRWTSSFQDFDYALGDELTVSVEWEVTSGYAEYQNFGLKGKGFTPVSPDDPASGELVSADQSSTTVTVVVRFTGLHWDAERQVDVGNAHFKLYLEVESDGDGVADTLAGFGVNIHVEDPA